MSVDYQFKYMPLVGKLPGKSMAEQTENAINEIAKIVNDNSAQAEIINTLAQQANDNSAEALEKATEALQTSGRVYIKESNPVNLNDYCESQLIYIDSLASTNLPVNRRGFLEVKTNDDKTQATQVFVDDLNKEIYTRSGAITETQVGDVTTYTASYGAWNKSASTNYVENMVLIRQNSTAYSVGDIARSTSLASYMLLECTSAGTTGASEPSYEGVDVGDVITDGSVSWTIIEYASTEYVQEEVAKYLPLNGGTMTGAITSSDETVLRRPTTDSFSMLCGSTGYSTGAHLRLYEKDDATHGGKFYLFATDANNSSALEGRPDGTLIWGGNDIALAKDVTAINTRLGTILSASGDSTTVSDFTTLCSITTHPAGVWLIIGFVALNYSGTGIYNNGILTANHSGSNTRNTSMSGGGNVNVFLTELNENEVVSLRGYQSEQGTIRGNLKMVQLA